MVALGGTFGINLSNYSKKQIRTNFDLRNSSDLLRLVTRTGIGRLARRSLVVGGSDDHLGRHSTPPCSIPCFVQILIKKEPKWLFFRRDTPPSEEFQKQVLLARETTT